MRLHRGRLLWCEPHGVVSFKRDGRQDEMQRPLMGIRVTYSGP